MNKLFLFISSMTFWKHIAIIIAIVVSIFYILNFSLSIYTRNGFYIEVPLMKGKTVESLEEWRKTVDATFELDTIYQENAESGTILLQNPDEGSKIKNGRTIYLTIQTNKPPEYTIPDIKDNTYNLKVLTTKLNRMGIKIGAIEYRDYPARDEVLDVFYKGRPITGTTPIKKGDVVSVVLGNGFGSESVNTPNLVGLSLSEAKFALKGSRLSLGKVINQSDKPDSLLIIYQQNPSRGTEINAYDKVDIYLQ